MLDKARQPGALQDKATAKLQRLMGKKGRGKNMGNAGGDVLRS